MNKKKKMVYLDVIRILSVGMIICCHFSCTFQQFHIGGFNNYLLRFPSTDTGVLGVALFFMISGSGLIYRYTGEFNMATFYRKRFLSLLPPLWLCWLFFYLIEVYKRGNFLYNGSPLRFFWTLIGMDYYVGGGVPTYALVGEWFTGAILCIYILFPLLRLLYLNRAARLTTTAVLFGIFLRCLFYSNFSSFAPPGNQSLFVHIFYFWTGMLLIESRDKWRNIPWVILIAAGVPFLVLSIPWPTSLTTYIIALVIYLAAGKLETLRLPDRIEKAYAFIIANSYFIYLVHHQTIYLIMTRFENRYLPVWKGCLLLLACILLMCLIAAALSRCHKKIMSFILKPKPERQ